MVPTLLPSTLVEIYIDLSKETRADLTEVKKVLTSKAGLTKDPLVTVIPINAASLCTEVSDLGE